MSLSEDTHSDSINIYLFNIKYLIKLEFSYKTFDFYK